MLKTRTHGFTIVELLIIIVVISILAAITIVAYNGIQNRASESAVQSDIAALRKKFELFKVDSISGNYPSTSTEFNQAIDMKLTKSAYDQTQNNIYYFNNLITGNYAIGLRAKSGKGYIVTNNGINEGVTINANAVAIATGASAWSDGNKFSLQGYSVSGGVGTWSTIWYMVKD